MSLLKINGRDIESLGLRLGDQGSLWSAPQAQRGSTPILGRIGSRSSSLAVSPGSTLPLLLHLPETVALRRAALDKALAWMDGLLVLEWDDAPGRVQFGRVESNEVRARFQSVAWVVGHLTLPVVVQIDTPAWFDWAASSVAWGPNIRTATPLGTLPSSPLLLFSDSVSGSITIEYRGQAGTVLSSLVISNPSLTSGQMLLIDCGAEQIYKVDGATLTLANNLYSSGSFPVLDPGDGDFEASSWPTLNANFAGSATYRRVWR
jgi:hypothetical protein